MDENGGDKGEADLDARLRRVATMFSRHRDDPLMRELCRLAVKCAREGWADA